jgi:heme-degrading monooxygenase HmoA
MFQIFDSIMAIGRQIRQNSDDMTRPAAPLGRTGEAVPGPLALEWRATLATRWGANSASDSRWKLRLENGNVGGAVDFAPRAPRSEPRGGSMIARLWRGQTSAAKAQEYLEYLRVTGVEDYTKTPGNRGVRILRRISGDKAEFLVLSAWDSLEAIQGFAGSDYQKAVYYPEDRKYLTHLDPEVSHFDVVLDTTNAHLTPDT